MDALTGVDHRTLGVDQRLGSLARVGRVRTRAIGRRRRVVDRLFNLGAPEVAGNLQHDGPLAAVLGVRERAPNGVGEVVGVGQLLGPLAHVLEVDQTGEIGRHIRLRASVAAGNRNHRRRLRPGLGQAAERVLGAGTILGQVHGHPVARVHAGKGVGDVNPGPLLAHDDRADIGLGRRLEDRIDGIADHEVDPFPLQHLGNRVCSSHTEVSLRFGPHPNPLPQGEGNSGWLSTRLSVREASDSPTAAPVRAPTRSESATTRRRRGRQSGCRSAGRPRSSRAGSRRRGCRRS